MSTTETALKARLLRVGRSQSPIIVIDEFSGAMSEIGRIADKLAPFPKIRGNYYPGVRRLITKSDWEAHSYAVALCRRAAPLIGRAFGVSSFDLDEASFSIVTLQPGDLHPVQKAPHFDAPDPNLLAMLHYIRMPEGSGTAFYRHRSTGIERISEQNLGYYVAAAGRELPRLAGASGYINGSNSFYEQIASVEAVPDRVVIYHGNLLHSGIIPEDMSFSADPREGRLTANFFLKGPT